MQIREEEKMISSLELARHLNVNENQIERLIGDGYLPESINESRWYPGALLSGLKNGGAFPYVSIESAGTNYFIEIINSVLVVEQGGVFVVPSTIHPSKDEGIQEMLENYGVWEAQGKFNQISLVDVTPNPIDQIVLAHEIIEVWKNRIAELKLPHECIIYWTGSVDSTLSIYLMPGKNESFLKQHEQNMGIKNVTREKVFLNHKDQL